MPGKTENTEQMKGTKQSVRLCVQIVDSVQIELYW